MRQETVFFILMLMLVAISPDSEALTRAPLSENERSLLYWRYLCENQPQIEVQKNTQSSESVTELTCKHQKWKVSSMGGRVWEVVTNAKD